MGLSGGRTWWVHFEFTRINIEPIILRKKIEDFRKLGAVILSVEDLIVAAVRRAGGV